MWDSTYLRLHRALRWPPLHFALVGALLFAGESALRVGDSAECRRAPRRPTNACEIEVTDRRVRALVAQHERRVGQSADPETVRALVDRFVEEEILYREALRHGLASDNPAVVLRLRQKLEFLDEGHADGMEDEAVLREAAALGLADEDIVLRNMFVRNMRLLLARQGDRVPTEAELDSHLQRNAEDLRACQARVSWRHVHLAKTGSRAEAATLRGRRAPRADFGAKLRPPDRTAAARRPLRPAGTSFRGMTGPQIGSALRERASQTPSSPCPKADGRIRSPPRSAFTSCGSSNTLPERDAEPRRGARPGEIELAPREQRDAHLEQSVAALAGTLRGGRRTTRATVWFPTTREATESTTLQVRRPDPDEGVASSYC